MSLVPTLLTPRLVLRGHHVDDLAACTAMWSDPEVTRHIGGRPFTEEDVWARIMRYTGHWALLGFGYWAVVERESERFVGEVGLADMRRDQLPDFHGAAEVGWALAPWAQGRGLATEAVMAALGWAEGALVGMRTVCMIEPSHPASHRVASKCGFVAYDRVDYKGESVVLLERR